MTGPFYLQKVVAIFSKNCTNMQTCVFISINFVFLDVQVRTKANFTNESRH